MQYEIYEPGRLFDAIFRFHNQIVGPRNRSNHDQSDPIVLR